MQDGLNIKGKTETMRAELRAHLGVRGPTLEKALRRAGRRLPRNIRTQAARLVDAERLGGNPKLERLLNGPEIETAYGDVMAHLRKVDRGDAIRGRVLSVLGILASNLIAIFAVTVWWLWSNGRL